MRIIFYTDVTWSLGNVHNNLVKQLGLKGIYSNMLNWDTDYSLREMEYLDKIYDVFVTLPGNAVNLLISKGINPNKIICIAHSRYDVWHGVTQNIPWNSLRSVIAISPDLVDTHRRLGVTAPIQLVQNGIDFNLFYREPAKELTNMGYFGSDIAPDVTDNNIDIKRKRLAEEVARQTELPLVLTGSKLVNLCMPTLYDKIDSLIMPSTIGEACGLPYMEAAAAGKLPISAASGIVNHLGSPAGIVVGMDDVSFVEQSVTALKELKQNPDKFRSLCVEAQEFARVKYDWSAVIDRWIEVFTGTKND